MIQVWETFDQLARLQPESAAHPGQGISER